MSYFKSKTHFALMMFLAVIMASSFPLSAYAQNLVINTCSPVGTVEYKANGCETSVRTCCQGGQTSSGFYTLQKWSGWDEDCPEICVDKTPCTSDADCCGGKVCKISFSGGVRKNICQLASSGGDDDDNCVESEKPTCSILNGTCSYICTCSNGKWINCTKTVSCKSGFRLAGTTDVPCCENVNCGKTGPNGWQYPCYCPADIMLDYGWVFQTDRHSCNMASGGTDPTAACGQCNASNNGAHCTLRNNNGMVGDINNGWNCTLYICQFGGGTTRI